MKHLAQIQVEFLKSAAEWDSLSLETQKQYLMDHPGSERRITAKPHRSEDPEVSEFFKLFSNLKPNSSVWFQDGTQRPFLQSLRKFNVDVSQIEENKTYLVWDNGGGVYEKDRTGDFVSTGYFMAPSILRTGKFVNDEKRGNMVEAQVHGSTFKVTSDSGFANTPSTGLVSKGRTDTGFVFIEKPFAPPQICNFEDAVSELKRKLSA